MSLTDLLAVRTELWFLRSLCGVLAEVAVFVPAGLLAVFSLAPHQSWWRRLLGVVLPATAIVAASAILVHSAVAQPAWRWPPAVRLIPPVAGGLFGIWLASAWRRGPRARAWILPKLGATALFGLGGIAYVGLQVPEGRPLPFQTPEVTTADRHRLRRLFSGKDPRQVPEGETQTLRLPESALNELIALGSFAGRSRAAKARIDLDDETVRLSVSVALPSYRSRRSFLNLVAAGRVAVEDGDPRLRLDWLSAGPVSIPDWALRIGSPLLVSSLRLDSRLAPLLGALRETRVQGDAVELVYGRTSLPEGFLSELFHSAASIDVLVPAVRAYAHHLVEVAPRLPGGEARFGAAMEEVFGLARSRSQEGDARGENRAALLALGMLAGHWRVESLVGPVLDAPTRRAGLAAYRDTTLRGRRDWVQHYLVSAALALLADVELSDAAGLLKEELDSRGGSGFSFGDLAADRAGTALATTATRDYGSARALQEHLLKGFRVDDFLPEAADLPEGLTELQLEQRFGGVGGERYRRVVGIIETRVASCAAYRY
jgi:hypothetical protein